MLYLKYHAITCLRHSLSTTLPTIYRRSLASVKFARVPKPSPNTSNSSPWASEQPDEVFTLSNGHTMGYATCGPETCPAVFYLHGYPDSRIGGLMTSRVAAHMGIRIISPDRPGIGLSTFDPNRRIIDYPNHIAQLASYLRLRSYSVLGCSGGAPYAMACAKLLPKSQLKRVGIAAGLGPVALGLDGIPMKIRIRMNLARWMPSLTALFLVRDERFIDREGMWNELKHHASSLTPARRKIVLDDSENLDLMLRNSREHYRQGLEGSIKDAQLSVQPWGFRLEDVDFEKIMLWYGTEDINTPVQMGRKMAARLKNARLREYPGEDHHSLLAFYGAGILKAMLEGSMGP